MIKKITDKMFSIHTDDECFYVGMNRGNDKSQNYSPEPTHFTPYQCCPTTVEKASARIAILSDTNLGSSKEHDNEITFRFTKAAPMTNSPPSKSKASKVKAPKTKLTSVASSSSDDDKPKKAKKEEKESKNKDTDVAPSKKLREREVKETKETKDKDSDKKDKKGKDKKDKGKNAQDDDGIFKLSNWW